MPPEDYYKDDPVVLALQDRLAQSKKRQKELARDLVKEQAEEERIEKLLLLLR